MNMKRTLNALIVVMLMTLAAIPGARAASGPRILQQRMNPDTFGLTLYARHTGGAEVSGVRLDGTAVEDAVIAKNASETTLRTWILLDNSTSMPEDIRPRAADLLTTLLGEKGRGETYNFCTFSDKLNIQLRDSNSFADLKKRIDGLEYHEQRTDFISAIEEVLTEESGRTGDEFVRIVMVSTGGDGVPTEQSVKNLRDRNAVLSVPIYVIGCDGGNADALRRMYDLSEETFARHWNMNEVDAADIAKIMHWEEIPVRASLTIPGSLRTGTQQEIDVTFSDGSSARSTVSVPKDDTGDTGDTENAANISDTANISDADGAGDTENISDADGAGDTENISDADGVSNTESVSDAGGVSGAGDTEPPTQKGGLSTGAVALTALCVLALTGGAVAFLMFRRKARLDATPAPASYDAEHANAYGVEPPGIPLPDALRASGGDGSRFTLSLTDLDAPERQFSASLGGRVSVGRLPDNVIALDYDRSISRRHCEIYCQNGKLWIQDSGSSGGAYIGNERVTGATELPNGAVIRLGHVHYKVEVR